MIRLILALLLAMPLHACSSCLLLADMALTARAMAEDGISQSQSVRVMARIYTLTGISQNVIEQVVTASASVSMAPHVYAMRVKDACESVKRGDKEV